MPVILLSSQADSHIYRHLSMLQSIVIPVAPVSFLQQPVSCHPDMLFFAVNDKSVICEPRIYQKYAGVFIKNRLSLSPGSTVLLSHYPENIAYNIARVSNIAFHHTKYTDRTVCEALEKEKIRLVHVNQGYAGCSACVVGDRAVITSDPSIAKAALRENIDVLQIREGHIALSGYSHGFIGGASGLLHDKLLYFTGNIESHPDARAIFAFLKNHGVSSAFLKDVPLQDLGTVLGIF